MAWLNRTRPHAGLADSAGGLLIVAVVVVFFAILILVNSVGL